MKSFAFTIFFIFTFAIHVVYSCSIRTEPLPNFDETEYVFIGEVIGYTEPLEFNRKIPVSGEAPHPFQLSYKQATGLIVKVKESVYLPRSPKSYFEVFPFSSDGACFTLGFLSEKLKRQFPQGSEIIVIAKEAKYFPHVLPNGNFRLEERLRDRSFIALNSSSKGQKLVSIDSFFDYQKMKTDPAILISSRFEIRKDLFRLKNAKSQQERQAILDRFFYFDKLYLFIEFHGLTQKYMADAKEAEEFFRKHLKLAGFSKKIIEEEIAKRQKQMNKSKRN